MLSSKNTGMCNIGEVADWKNREAFRDTLKGEQEVAI